MSNRFFTMKSWLDRVVQFPFRRKITIESQSAAEIVGTLARAEGTVTTEGDVLDAATLNALENRIDTAFSAIETEIDALATENAFELIETITLTEDTIDVERSAEPNLTPYRFKKVRVEIAGDAYGGNPLAIGMCVNYTQAGYESSDCIIRRNVGSSTKNLIFINAYCENDNIFGEMIPGTGTTVNNPGSNAIYKACFYKTGSEINSLSISAYNNASYIPLKAGTKLKIYGVRI